LPPQIAATSRLQFGNLRFVHLFIQSRSVLAIPPLRY
jgi:hypothetical protein